MGCGRDVSQPPGSRSTEGAQGQARQPPVPPLAVMCRAPPPRPLSSRAALPLRRDTGLGNNEQRPLPLPDTSKLCPRRWGQAARYRRAARLRFPPPPRRSSAGPCRSGWEADSTPPPRVWRGAVRHGTARRGRAHPRHCVSARRTLLGGVAAGRDAEGLRAPSETAARRGFSHPACWRLKLCVPAAPSSLLSPRRPG